MHLLLDFRVFLTRHSLPSRGDGPAMRRRARAGPEPSKDPARAASRFADGAYSASDESEDAVSLTEPVDSSDQMVQVMLTVLWVSPDSME